MSGRFTNVVDDLVALLERCGAAIADDDRIPDGDDLQVRRWGRDTIDIHPAAWFEQREGDVEAPDIGCSTIDHLQFDLRFSAVPDADGDAGDMARLELLVDAVLPVVDAAMRDRSISRCRGYRTRSFQLGREAFGDAVVGVLSVPIRIDWRTAIPDPTT